MLRNKFYLGLNNTYLNREIFHVQGVLLLVLLSLAFSLLPSTVSAEEDSPESDIVKLEGITVTDEFLKDQESISVIDRERIEGKQSSNVLELLRELPSTSSHGGPRTGGMGISIRGFGNNEDVIVRIDGATQNFEKYRYGLGLSIDPELLKQVEVVRGAAALTRGSGALGGVVEMETVDARDLLASYEKFGMRAKYGYSSNNDGHRVVLTAMARPTDFIDLLLSGVKRDTDDFRLPSGERLPYSEETRESGLAKFELHNDYSETTFAYRFSEESGQELHDARAGTGVRGLVYRASTEDSYTFNTHVAPNTDWLDIKSTIAYTDKLIIDDHVPGAERSLITGNYQYDIWTAELVNRSGFKIFGQQNFLTIGAQYNQEHRITSELDMSAKDAQPSGKKTSYGLFLTQEMIIGDFIVGATLRGDKYSIDSADLAKQLLEETGRSSSVDFTKMSPGFSVDYGPASWPVSVFYNYAELFRVPLIDELFTTPVLGGGRCRHFSFYQQTPPFPDLRDFLPDVAAWRDAVDDWHAAKDSAFNEDNAICADFYEPEQSKNHEIGVVYNKDGVFTGSDIFNSKITFFYTKVENTLESLYQNTVTSEISQPGIEVHHGFEVELKYDSPTYFTSLVLSTLDGYRDLRFYENNPDPAIEDLGGEGLAKDLIDKPADKVIFTIGRNFESYNFRIGYRLEAYDDHLVSAGMKPPPCHWSNPACIIIGSQSGYTLHDIFAVWQPRERTVIRLNIDNITNKEYNIPGIGKTDNLGPGIDIRLSFSQQF